MKPSRNPTRRCDGRGENAATAAGVRPAGERNRDFARCALGPEPRTAAAAWSAACDRVHADAAALTPACGLLGTRCLKDLAGAISAATGTAALAIEVGTLGLGTPVSTMLGLVSVGTGAYSTLGTCLYDGGSSCGVSIVGTTFAAAAPAGGALRAVGVVGRDAATAWHLTFEFMAMPFGLTGPLLWLEEALPR